MIHYTDDKLGAILMRAAILIFESIWVQTIDSENATYDIPRSN